MKITLRQVAAFNALARHASLRKAAESLSLSPSAVSMALRDLEQILGAPLFHRDHRRMVLNENGRRLLPDVLSLLNQARRVERGHADRPLEGTLRIGASSTIGTYLAPALCARFLAANPGVRIDLLLQSSIDVVREIEALTIDIGFIEAPTPRLNLEKIPWSGDSLVIFASPRHRLAGRRVSPRELLREHWCLQPMGSITRNRFMRLITDGHADAEVSVALETSNVESIKGAVAAGQLLGCLSDRALEGEFSRGELVPLKLPVAALRRPYFIVSPRQVYRGEMQQAFIEFAQRHPPTETPPPTPAPRRPFRKTVRSIQKIAA